MEHENLFARLRVIINEVNRLDKENPTPPDEPSDPRIVSLLDEGMRIQKELDPLMRETFRGRKELIAEWDEIMHMCDEDDEAEPPPPD